MKNYKNKYFLLFGFILAILTHTASLPVYAHGDEGHEEKTETIQTKDHHKDHDHDKHSQNANHYENLSDNHDHEWGDALNTVSWMPPLHVIAVHFPIALFSLAALLSLWGIFVNVDNVFPTIKLLIYFGALSALVSVGTGLYFEESIPHQHGGPIDPVMEWHEYMGFASAIVASFLAMFTFFGKNKQNKTWQKRISLGTVALAILIGMTAHFGGILVHYFGVGLME